MKIKERSELISKVNRALREDEPLELNFREFTTIWNLTVKQNVGIHWAIKTTVGGDSVLITKIKGD